MSKLQRELYVCVSCVYVCVCVCECECVCVNVCVCIVDKQSAKAKESISSVMCVEGSVQTIRSQYFVQTNL